MTQIASKKRPRVIYNPVDIMSKEERKEYTKGGVVLEYHIYKDIGEVPPIKVIRAMDKEKAEEVLSKAMSYHTQRELSDYWGKSQGIFRTLHKNYNLPRISKGRRADSSVETDKSAKLGEWVKREDLENALTKLRNVEDNLLLLKNKNEKLSKEISQNGEGNNKFNFFENQGQYLSLVRKGVGSSLGSEIANIATVLDEDRTYRITFEVREVVENKKDSVNE